MAKYKGREPDLFDAFVEETKFQYPICIEYTEGLRYGNGNVEAFFENGVKTFISTKGNSSSFLKTKFVPKYSNTEEEARKEYELYIKTLLYIHTEISPEEFNRRYEAMELINSNLDSLLFEDSFRQAKEHQGEQNISGVTKVKEQLKNEETVITAKKDDIADHPF